MASAENKQTASPMALMVAEMVRTMRIQRGWTQEQLGLELGYSAAAVSAMETCAQPASDAMLVELERVLGNGTYIFQTARRYMRMDKYPEEFKDYVLLEQAALSLQVYAANFIHGLFQTQDYARALIGGGFPPLPDPRVEELVEVRMARKALFDREPVAMIEAVLDESALIRGIGSDDIMRDQMRYLANVAKRRNVSLQVLPLDAGLSGEYAAGHGSLNIVEGADHKHRVYLEVQEESWTLSDPTKVSTHAQRCAKIRAEAMGPRESLKFFERLAGDRK
ncbi:helix-turn-helix domain-containing protein [Streptomyces anulatus]|uniref:helix-turn-helix domain-containing protein n=1 Tax=Streptomyces anulatus TaxID=1892 RepID=UPI0033C5BAF8